MSAAADRWLSAVSTAPAADDTAVTTHLAVVAARGQIGQSCPAAVAVPVAAASAAVAVAASVAVAAARGQINQPCASGVDASQVEGFLHNAAQSTMEN